jgi:Flp pilus assembly protein TadD
MNRTVALKFAVSALAIGTTMVACKPAGSRIASASVKPAKAAEQAGAAFAKAEAAAQKGDYTAALPFAERAVEASPRDLGYRMLLADLYLKNGRFQSAETAFGDVLSLDPGNGRASLGLALARIGLGRTAAALDGLEGIEGRAPAADVGLAFALAGESGRAIAILEPAARAPGATGRVRQNLALAYAFAGDWQKAQSIAAQDVSPADLSARLQQWADMARPSAPQARIAGLLGVTPAVDPGQPTRLALVAPQPEPVALAAAEPVPAPVEPVVVAVATPAPAPVDLLPAAPVSEPVRSVSTDLPQWVSERAAEEAAAPEDVAREVETKPVYAEAVQSLVAPKAAVFRASAPRVAPTLTRFERPSTRAHAPAAPRAGAGRFAVQLGAFASASGVERAWAAAYRRYGFGSHTPLSTTVKIPGKGTFHRLSVAGFGSRDEAARTCATVRAKGGACFVRAVAGDAPVLWASRYVNRRGG